MTRPWWLLVALLVSASSSMAGELRVRTFAGNRGGTATSAEGDTFDCADIANGYAGPKTVANCRASVRDGTVIYATDYTGDAGAAAEACDSVRNFARATSATTCKAYLNLVENRGKNCFELSTDVGVDGGRCRVRSYFVME